MEHSRAREFLILVIVYVLLLHGLTMAMSRYRLPLMPAVILSAAWFAARPSKALPRLASPVRATACVLLLASQVLAWSLHFDKIWMRG